MIFPSLSVILPCASMKILDGGASLYPLLSAGFGGLIAGAGALIGGLCIIFK